MPSSSARRLACSKVSSGREIAVFMLTSITEYYRTCRLPILINEAGQPGPWFGRSRSLLCGLESPGARPTTTSGTARDREPHRFAVIAIATGPRRPDFADAGRALLYQFGVGLAELFVTEQSASEVPAPGPTITCSAWASSAACSPGQPATATRGRSTPSGTKPVRSGQVRPAARECNLNVLMVPPRPG